MVTASLQVHCKELHQAITSAANFFRREIRRREGLPRAVLTFDGEYLLLEVPISLLVPRPRAFGNWPGEATVDFAFLYEIRKFLVGEHRVELRVEDGRFWVDRGSVPCSWRPARRSRQPVRFDQELVDLLSLRLNATDVQLRRMGLLEAVWAADERAAELIHRAVEILSPLGVSAEQIAKAADTAASYNACRDRWETSSLKEQISPSGRRDVP